MENRILSAIASSRTNYEQVKSVLGSDGFSSTFSPLAQVLARTIENYYARDSAAVACTRETLLDRIEAEGYNPKHVKALKDIVDGIEWTVSVPNLLADIRLQKQRRIGDKLAGLLANRSDPGEIDDLLTQYKALSDEPEASSESDPSDMVFREIPAEDLIREHFHQQGTIGFGLPKLTEVCNGGARPGHHILIYARPEIGKTHFAIELVSNWCRAGKGVVYIGNEDPLADITLRLVQRISGLERRVVFENPQHATGLIFARGYANFTGVNMAPGNYRQIRDLTEKYKPDIVVIDQLRNIDVGDDNRVTALEKAAIGARNLAKSKGIVVVSVTQAGESGEGKAFLDLSDIDFSKTGIPGAIDLAIGIGATEEYKRSGIRGISLPKNKLGGRHETYLVRFNTNIGTVEELD